MMQQRAARPSATVYERVAASVPVDRTAAIVAKGSDQAPAELTDRQLRENLLPFLAKIEEQLRHPLITKDRKKALGLVKLKLQKQISALKPKVLRPDYRSHFHEAARELLQPAMFRLICDEAARRCDRQEAPSGNTPCSQP